MTCSCKSKDAETCTRPMAVGEPFSYTYFRDFVQHILLALVKELTEEE